MAWSIQSTIRSIGSLVPTMSETTSLLASEGMSLIPSVSSRVLS